MSQQPVPVIGINIKSTSNDVLCGDTLSQSSLDAFCNRLQGREDTNLIYSLGDFTDVKFDQCSESTKARLLPKINTRQDESVCERKISAENATEHSDESFTVQINPEWAAEQLSFAKKLSADGSKCAQKRNCDEIGTSADYRTPSKQQRVVCKVEPNEAVSTIQPSRLGSLCKLDIDLNALEEQSKVPGYSHMAVGDEQTTKGPGETLCKSEPGLNVGDEQSGVTEGDMPYKWTETSGCISEPDGTVGHDPSYENVCKTEPDMIVSEEPSKQPESLCKSEPDVTVGDNPSKRLDNLCISGQDMTLGNEPSQDPDILINSELAVPEDYEPSTDTDSLGNSKRDVTEDDESALEPHDFRKRRSNKEEQFSESKQNRSAIDYSTEKEADQAGIPSTCKIVRDTTEDMDTHDSDDTDNNDSDADLELVYTDIDSEAECSNDEDIGVNSGGSCDVKTHVNEAYSRLMTTNVTIPSYVEREGGKRNYRKTNYCLFCNQPFMSNISSHYITIHSNEEKVKRAILHQIGSKERKRGLLEIENKGNFLHNVAVIKKGEGELVVARSRSCKTKNTYTARNFLPCVFCLGFYMKDTLWLHSNSCPLKPKKKLPSANYIRDAKIMLTLFLPDITEEEANLETFFSGMKETTANPGIRVVCKNDVLIREFAKSMLYRLGDKSEQRVNDIGNVRTKVRTIGRLLKELNHNTDIARPLSDFITGRNFSRVIDATKSIALKSNSVALAIGHYIKQIALLKVRAGIQKEKPDDVNEGRNFHDLYLAHWNNRVSSIAKRGRKMSDVAGSIRDNDKTCRQMDSQRERELFGEGTSCNEAERLGEEDAYERCSDMSDLLVAKGKECGGQTMKRL